jgi:hydroxymethylglutaryl-CoA reductase (NADPH)
MDINSELLERLMKGEIKLHELDAKDAHGIRKKYLEKKLDLELNSIHTGMNDKICKSNIENMFGAIHVPLGVAGPVKVKGENAKGELFIPLATTEGALVASVNRGCRAINESGGADAVIIKNEQTRSILFKFVSIKDVKEFTIWAEKNFEKLKNAGEENERFLEIKKIESYAVGMYGLGSMHIQVMPWA